MQGSTKRVVMLGCFDTKGPDFSYLYDCLASWGVEVIAINLGVQKSDVEFRIDIDAPAIAAAAGTSIEKLRTQNDRGLALEKMAEGAAIQLEKMSVSKQVDGAIAMGGGGGTFLALRAMQVLPFGLPKVCLSTLAAKDLSRDVGHKDILLMPSVVDVAGVNPISALLIAQSAGALVGMIRSKVPPVSESRGTVAISMFGNTTTCVNHCTLLLKDQDFEVLPFHAVGSGGMTMEGLVKEGLVDAVLDLTTTELADHLCGGICSAGPERLTAAGDMGIPQVVSVGCLDMVNFGHPDTVPKKFRDRLLYSWAPDVTLMRTNAAENAELGRMVAEKLNRSATSAAVLIPTKAISLVSAPGEVFHDPKADRILFDAIRDHLDARHTYRELDLEINDPAFARHAVDVLLEMLS